MKTIKTLMAVAIATALVTGCSTRKASVQAPSQNSSTDTTFTEQRVISESRKANQLFDELFMEQVMLSPTFQTALGIKTDQDKWDDISEAGVDKAYRLSILQLERVKSTINEDALNAQTKLSYQLFVSNLENDIADYQWRYHTYPVNQMFGVHAQVPALLINQHQVNSLVDAQDYIARLRAVSTYFDQLIDGLNIRADKGILPPRFVFPYVINDSRNIMSGAPFEKGEDSALMADFSRKVSRLEIPNAEKKRLIKEAQQALTVQVGPAYEQLNKNTTNAT